MVTGSRDVLGLGVVTGSSDVLGLGVVTGSSDVLGLGVVTGSSDVLDLGVAAVFFVCAIASLTCDKMNCFPFIICKTTS